MMELKTSYRKLAKVYHPDKNRSEGAHHQFQLVNEAYNYLLRYGVAREAFDEWNVNTYEELMSKVMSICPEKVLTFASTCKSFIEKYINDPLMLEKVIHNMSVNLGNNTKHTKERFGNVSTSGVNDVKSESNIECDQSNGDSERNEHNYIHHNYDGQTECECEDKQECKPYDMFDEPFSYMRDKNAYDVITDLSQMLNDTVYLLPYGDERLPVPLWFSELSYDVDDEQVVASVYPSLPNNVHIDDDNTLHVSIMTTLKSLLSNNGIPIDMYISPQANKCTLSTQDDTNKHNSSYSVIKPDELRIEYTQTVVREASGLLQVCEQNDSQQTKINTTNRCDVIFHITIIDFLYQQNDNNDIEC